MLLSCASLCKRGGLYWTAGDTQSGSVAIGFEPLFTSMESLLRHFRLKESHLKLKNLQVANPLKATTANGIPVVYGLLRPQDTRWSSWLYAAQRLCNGSTQS